MDRYAAHNIVGDFGVPNAPWGTRLKHLPKDGDSQFAAAETRIGRLLEDAADLLDLWIEEDVAAALTSFIDPAYAHIILPFVRPWFARNALAGKPLAAERDRSSDVRVLQGNK